jgi:hypothetical protein
MGDQSLKMLLNEGVAVPIDPSMDIFKKKRRIIQGVLMIPILGVIIAVSLITFLKGLIPQLILGAMGALIPYLITLAIIWRKIFT